MNLFKKILKKIKIIKNYLDKKIFINQLTKKILKERYTVLDAKRYLYNQGIQHILELEGYIYDKFKYIFGWQMKKNIFFAVVYKEQLPIFTVYQIPTTLTNNTDAHKECDILEEKIEKGIEEFLAYEE